MPGRLPDDGVPPLLLLPPSAGKTAGAGPPLDPVGLSFPELSDTRDAVRQALIDLCRDSPQRAARILGLGPKQRADVGRNTEIGSAPTAPASALYTGVLFTALDLASVPSAARTRVAERVLIVSGLFGLVRPDDRLPTYRLPIGTSLPPLGPLSTLWRAALTPVLNELAADRLVVDLRSTPYATAWRPTSEIASRTALIRVLRRAPDGRLTVISHDAKRTRGEVARLVLTTRATLRDPTDLVRLLRRHWPVEALRPGPTGTAVDLIV